MTTTKIKVEELLRPPNQADKPNKPSENSMVSNMDESHVEENNTPLSECRRFESDLQDLKRSG
jgi:hypothetical protein